MLERWLEFLGRLPSLFVGLFLFAVGVVANLYSGLGMSPWGVLSVGITKQVPLTLGQASQVVGLIVLLLGWLLGFPPGLGTFANMYFIGLFMDLIMKNGFLPKPEAPFWQFSMLFFSIAVLGVASFFYLRVRLGAGPRDGLMLGLVRTLGREVSHVRGAIEVFVLIVGWALGGPVGLGTVVTSITIGYSVQLAFRLGGFETTEEHMDLFDLARYLSEV